MRKPPQLKSAIKSTKLAQRSLPNPSDALKEQRTTYAIGSASILILELLDNAVTFTDSPQETALTLIVTAILLFAGSFGPPFKTAYIAFFFGGEMSGILSNLSFHSVGIYIIAASWLKRERIIPTMLLLITHSALAVYQLGFGTYSLIFTALPAAITIIIGLNLQWQHRCYTQKAQETATLEEQITTIESDTRQAIAADLHDTLAKDLALIALQAQRLARTPSHARAEDLQSLADAATSASRKLRPIILNLDTSRHIANLAQTLNSAHTLLSTRGIALIITSPEDIEGLLSREVQKLASLFIREGAANALKYGAEKSSASLEMELAGNLLSLTFTNIIAPQGSAPARTGITGGYGLANLADRMKQAGGTLDFASVAHRWILHATIPLQKGPHT